MGGAVPSVRILDTHLGQQPAEDGLLSSVQCADFHTYLADNILEYTDKTSMSHGLECRVPFLDRRLVELSLRIPTDLKIRGGRTKAILRDAYPELLPKSILDAPKRGFCPPIYRWMADHFDRRFDELLARKHVRDQGVFDYDQIQRLRGEHRAGRRDNAMELFSILMFDNWFRSQIAA